MRHACPQRDSRLKQGLIGMRFGTAAVVGSGCRLWLPLAIIAVVVVGVLTGVGATTFAAPQVVVASQPTTQPTLSLAGIARQFRDRISVKRKVSVETPEPGLKVNHYEDAIAVSIPPGVTARDIAFVFSYTPITEKVGLRKEDTVERAKTDSLPITGLLNTRVGAGKGAPQLYVAVALDGFDESLWIGPLSAREIPDLDEDAIKADIERRAEAAYSLALQLGTAASGPGAKKLTEVIGNYPGTRAALKAAKDLGIGEGKAKQIADDTLERSFTNSPKLAQAALDRLRNREDRARRREESLRAAAEKRRQEAEEQAVAEKKALEELDKQLRNPGTLAAILLDYANHCVKGERLERLSNAAKELVQSSGRNEDLDKYVNYNRQLTANAKETIALMDQIERATNLEGSVLGKALDLALEDENTRGEVRAQLLKLRPR